MILSVKTILPKLFHTYSPVFTRNGWSIVAFIFLPLHVVSSYSLSILLNTNESRFLVVADRGLTVFTVFSLMTFLIRLVSMRLLNRIAAVPTQEPEGRVVES
jgi:hypothetical protein